MPKLKTGLPGGARFNTLMSVVALLQRVGEIHIDELAERFKVAPDAMREMLRILNMTTFLPRNSQEHWPFFIDSDQIAEDGMVSLRLEDTHHGVPKITAAQSATLLSALNYLRSIPDFEESAEIDDLVAMLSHTQPPSSAIAFDGAKFDNDLVVLKKAILTNRRIECRYVNAKGEESTRLIDPLLLVTAENHWYLRGYCPKNSEVRTFRLDHMVDAKIIDEQRSDEAMEAAKSLDETAPIYSPSENDVEVVIELDPEAFELAGVLDQISAPKVLETKSIRVSVKMGYLPDLGPLVCRYGTHARVISPKAAKDVVRRFAQQALGEDNMAGDID